MRSVQVSQFKQTKSEPPLRHWSVAPFKRESFTIAESIAATAQGALKERLFESFYSLVLSSYKVSYGVILHSGCIGLPLPLALYSTFVPPHSGTIGCSTSAVHVPPGFALVRIQLSQSTSTLAR